MRADSGLNFRGWSFRMMTEFSFPNFSLPVMHRVFPKGLLTDQQKLALHLFEEQGLARKEIAARLNVTRARAFQLVKSAQERVKDYEVHGENRIFLVPARMRDFLEFQQLVKPEAIRAAIESGRLYWNEKRYGLTLKNPRREHYDPRCLNEDGEMGEPDSRRTDLPEGLRQFLAALDKPDEYYRSNEISPRNLGWKSWQQLHELAGLPVPQCRVKPPQPWKEQPPLSKEEQARRAAFRERIQAELARMKQPP